MYTQFSAVPAFGVSVAVIGCPKKPSRLTPAAVSVSRDVGMVAATS
jgi:hypothetical protein